MLVTLDIKENVIDKFMDILKQFSDGDIVIENQSFIDEKQRLQQELKSIDTGTAKIVSEHEIWERTEKTINAS